MSLFHRRSIQRMLGECSSLMTEEQATALVAKLNLENESSLHAQWELAVLFGLSKTGSVIYEQEIGSGKPDLTWTPKNSSMSIVADVRTVSDKGLDDENPREFFREELNRRVKRAGLNPQNFTEYPAGKVIGEWGDAKARLMYPKKRDANRLFDQRFEQFISHIKEKSPDKLSCHLTGEGFDVQIQYDISLKPSGGTYLAYNVYYSLTRNPIYNSLKAKSKQIRKTGFDGPTGIILTDGGCREISGHLSDPTGRRFDIKQVTEEFFSSTEYISFIVSIYVTRDREFLSGFGPRYIAANLFLNPDCRHPLSDDVINQINRIPSLLPFPKLDADNAARHLRKGWDGPQKAWYTGAQMTAESGKFTFKVPARALLDLMAGRISLQEFEKMHGLGGLTSKPFATLLDKGYVIKDADFSVCKGEDDDHVILTFEPDVAALAYTQEQNSDNQP